MAKKNYELRPLISFDWAIKKLLRDKADFRILEGFLTELLKQEIVIEEILESESNKDWEDDKQIVVDLLCKTAKQELVLIEIQFNRQIDFFHRMLFGTCKIVSERLKMGNRYEKVVKVYSVNLLYFELGHGKDYVYHGFTQFRGLYQEDILQNSPSQKEKFEKEHPGEIFPEYYLLRINQFNDVAKTPLDEWIYYLKNEALPKNYQAKGLSLVEEILKISKMDITQLKTYQKYKDKIVLSDSVYETAIIEGMHKGIQQGLQQGIEKGKTETIINAFKKGLDISFIADITALSEEQVSDILKENGLV
jgi:predicted transposase/invertase (TIGR01784 family)